MYSHHPKDECLAGRWRKGSTATEDWHSIASAAWSFPDHVYTWLSEGSKFCEQISLLSGIPRARTVLSYPLQRMKKWIQCEEVDEGPPHPDSQLKQQHLFLTSQHEGASCWFLLSGTEQANVLQTEVGSSKLSMALIA